MKIKRMGGWKDFSGFDLVGVHRFTGRPAVKGNRGWFWMVVVEKE